MAMLDVNTTTIPNVTDPPVPDLETTTAEFNYSLHMFKKVFFFALVLIMIFMTASGCVSNIINLIIFYRQGLFSDPCTPSFVGIALSDLCTCILGFTGALLRILNYWDNIYRCTYMGDIYYIDVFVRTPRFLLNQFIAWATVYLSLERMIGVSFPFQVSRLLTPKRSYFIIAAIFVLSFAFQSSALLHYKLVKMPYGNGLSYLYIKRLPFFPPLVTIDFQTINEVVFRMLSMALILIFNTITILALKNSRKFKKDAAPSNEIKNDHGSSDTRTKNKPKMKTPNLSTGSKASKETKVIRLMFVLGLVFVICNIPLSYAYTMYHYMRYIGVLPVFQRRLMDELSFFFEYVNASINIIIYYTMSARFKKELHQLCKFGD